MINLNKAKNKVTLIKIFKICKKIKNNKNQFFKILNQYFKINPNQFLIILKMYFKIALILEIKWALIILYSNNKKRFKTSELIRLGLMNLILILILGYSKNHQGMITNKYLIILVRLDHNHNKEE